MIRYLGISLYDEYAEHHAPVDNPDYEPERHDLYLDPDGNLAMVEDSASITQLCKQRLLAYRGEWFLNALTGVPWFQNILVRPFNEVISEALIKRTILQTRGVEELLSFEMLVNGEDIPDRTERKQHRRRLNVARADIRTEFDEVVEL